MSVSQRRNNKSYGLGNPLQRLAPQPIVSQRAPTTSDFADIGTVWVDVPSNAAYTLVQISSNSATWVTGPASGASNVTSLTANPGNITATAGDVVVTAGDLTVTAGNATIGGNLTVAGDTNVNGDFNLNSAALIDLVSTLDANPSILLHANGGTSEAIELHSDQGTGLESIFIHSDVGGIRLYAPGLANDAAIDLQADAGGLDVDVALQLSLVSSEAAADAIEVNASAGGLDVDAALQINIDSAQSAADALRLNTSNAAGGIDVDAGTGGIAIDSTGAISLDGAAASNFSTSGAGIDLTLASAAGRLIMLGDEDAASAVDITANGGTSSTITITNTTGTGTGSIDLDSTSGGIALATGLASDIAISLLATGGGVSISGDLQVGITSNENAADALVLQSTAGGIDIAASGAAAGEDIDIVATGSSVNITSTEAAADAIVLNASNAAGGIDISTGGGSVDVSSSGFVTMVAATDTQASPTAASTLNVNVGAVTFTGFTTASAAAQVFTITNSLATTTSQIFVTVNNEGANDAQMHVTRVNRAAGSFAVTVLNGGAAALNGNVTINFWIIG
jgi:hypothetical protein